MADEVNPGFGKKKRGQLAEEAAVSAVTPFNPDDPDAPSVPGITPVEAPRSKGWKRSGTIKCDEGAPHSEPAAVRLTVHGKQTPQHLCTKHYAKRLERPETFDRTSVESLTRADSDKITEVKDDAWRARTLEPKNREADLVFKATGALPVVPRTPGRPVMQNRSEITQEAINKGRTFLQNVVDRSATGGGHPDENHEELLDKAHKALVHSTVGNAGHPYFPAYENKALELGVPEHKVHEYFAHAVTHHRKLTGNSIVPPPTAEEKLERLTAEVVRNPSDAPSRGEETEGLMQNEGSYGNEFTPGAQAPKPRYD